MVPPVLAFPYIGLGNVAALVGIQLDDADAHVGAADVGGEDGVVAGQDPGGSELHAADQAGLVGMILDKGQLHRDFGAGQDERSAAHGQLADAARDQAAAQHDALGTAGMPCDGSSWCTANAASAFPQVEQSFRQRYG